MNAPQLIRRSVSQWQEIISRFSDSGLPATTFCERNDIAYGTFMRWRKRLSGPVDAPAKPQPSPDWLPIQIADSEAETERAWEIELVLPGGVQLRVRAA